VARRVLVTLGGSDPGNYTLRVLRALRRLNQPDLEVKVAIGTLNPHENRLEESIRDWEPPAVTLMRDVADISELMAWADLAVCSGGTTCLELAFMGLPALLVVLAENQANVAGGLGKAGAAINLGWHWQLSDAALADRLGAIMADQKTRSSMSARGQELVDGLGCQRVAACLEEKSRG
jgi:spore coat polysaccharide biosynthesis predicted glycosyltransferase SpsG